MNLKIVSLEDRIESINQQFGETVPVQEVTEIVGDVLGSLEGDLVLTEVHFHEELKALLDYIQKSKSDIAQIKPKDLSVNAIPDASNELDAIVKATEEAAGSIMDAADEIGQLAAETDGEMAEKLEAISMKIFEASSFQDITGQRVTKVVSTLQHLEEKLSELADTIGDDSSHIKEEEPEVPPEEMANEDLLHGPQLEGEGNSQDDIDALLASFD